MLFRGVIKTHSVYVMEGTRLADMYRAGIYTPPTLEEYADTVATIISQLPRDMLVAPEWNRDKNKVIATINEKLK